MFTLAQSVSQHEGKGRQVLIVLNKGINALSTDGDKFRIYPGSGLVETCKESLGELVALLGIGNSQVFILFHAGVGIHPQYFLVDIGNKTHSVIEGFRVITE